MQKFIETGLNEEIIKAISELGFENPTPIQEKTIPTILSSGQDIIALAQTGTGKTAAFGLPIVQLADTTSPNVQGLILCPTRELALQITEDLRRFAKHTSNLNVTPVYGGTDIRKQISDIRRGSQIIVGTPGRVNDLVGKGILKLDQVRWLVLDEADEMLNMGFKDELDAIIETTPEWRQTLLFSATMPREIADMVNRYMTDSLEIRVGNKNEGSSTISHVYYMVHARDRYLALKRIADIYPDIYGIIFCRTRQETKDVADKLIADGYNADALHGDLSQAQRDMVMSRFKTKHLQLLVATDVAARGIDVNDLTHVINYNLPDDIEAYTHRSGRTGRAGKTGLSIAIINMKEMGKIKAIERISKRKFEKASVPKGDEICEKQLFHLIEKVENIDITSDHIDKFLPAILDKLSVIDRDELVKRFVAMEFNRFLAYYQNAQDLNVYKEERSGREDRGERRERGERGERGGRRTNDAFSRLFINLGKTHDLTVPKLIGLINENTRNRTIEIGKIDILKNFSFFEVDKGFQDSVIEAISNSKFDGYNVSVEVASAPPARGGEGREGREKRSGGNRDSRGGGGSYNRSGGNREGRERRDNRDNKNGGNKERSYSGSGYGSGYGSGSDNRKKSNRSYRQS